jgi:hypothetical protein
MKYLAIFFLIILSSVGVARSQSHVNLSKKTVHLIQTKFPTTDYVITAYNIKDFGVDGISEKDVTGEFNLAIKTISENGGGTLWVPAGHYRFEGSLKLQQGVTIRGDWHKPEAGKATAGTVFEVYAGKGQSDGEPFITLGRATGLLGITIWYPEQDPEKIIPYPFTLRQAGGTNVTFQDITLINSYQGFVCGPNLNSLHFFRNVYASCLYRGFDIDAVSDIGRLENVHLSPRFWEESALPRVPGKNSGLRKWMYDNAIGLTVKRNDWSYMFDVEVEGYHIGYCTRRTQCQENLRSGDVWYANGQNYNLRFKGCKIAMDFEDTGNVGTIYARIQIENAETGLHFLKTFQEKVQFNRIQIDASEYAVYCEGTGLIQMQACEFKRGQVLMEHGGITIIDSDFRGSGPQIVLGKDVLGASILSNRFDKKPEIICDDVLAKDNIIIDHKHRDLSRMPDYPYKPPTEDFKPKSDKLFVVTDEPFNAKGNLQVDDTKAFENALEAAAKEGGTVYVPAGRYRITRNLVVGEGVELRGVFDVPHHSSGVGSVIYIYPGKGDENATPFLRLKSNSGLRGITFHYPEQNYHDIVAYPFMLQGMGKNIYIINVTSTIPYKMLDMFTYACDNHYIDYMEGIALKESIKIGGGSKNGRVYNCQLNPHNFTQTQDYENCIPSNAVLRQKGSSVSQEVSNFHRYLFNNHDAFIFGDCINECMHQNFVFGARCGLAFIDQNGKGVNGFCMGHGSDQCKYPVYIEKVGTDNPPDLLNIQLVTVEADGDDRTYIKLADSFKQHLRIFNLNAWGNPIYSCVVQNGSLELQLGHFAHCGEGVYKVEKGNLKLINCYARDKSPLIIAGEGAGQISVIGNIIQEYFKGVATNIMKGLPEKVILDGNIKNQTSLTPIIK